MIRPKNPYRRGTKKAVAYEEGIDEAILAVIDDLRRLASTARAADVPTLRVFLTELARGYRGDKND